MPTRTGWIVSSALSVNPNPYITADLNIYQGTLWPPSFEISSRFSAGPITHLLPVVSNTRNKSGSKPRSFFNDFYDRIHIVSTPIDAGVIAQSTIFNFELWNSYTLAKTLNTIALTNADGAVVSGQALPITFAPLEIKPYVLTVPKEGEASINAQFQFNFTATLEPNILTLTGTRALVIATVPDVPVGETWKWLTDKSVSFDSTEQRIALRNSPRVELNVDLLSIGIAEVLEIERLISIANGRLYLPHFQWATVVTQDSAIGATSVYFANAKTDTRANEYVLILEKTGYRLLRLETVTASYATLYSPLTAEIKAGALVIPCFDSYVDNNVNFNRGQISEHSKVTISADVIPIRASFTRPGHSATLTTFESYPVLNRRPTFKSLSNSYETGQRVIDNKTGLLDSKSDWAFSRVTKSVYFHVQRIMNSACGFSGSTEIDYFRLFFDTVKGELKPFLMSTFNKDQNLISTPADASNTVVLEGSSYCDTFYLNPSYTRLALDTNSGVHYCRVISASKTINNDTTIVFAPALPSGVGWAQINTISYLIKARLASDTVKVQHDSLKTSFSFGIRAIEE
jgi:hypothetical protein